MLCDKLKVNIYSFPMKYHPVNGDKHLNRDYLGLFWNRKFVLAIQTIACCPCCWPGIAFGLGSGMNDEGVFHFCRFWRNF